MFVQSVRVRAVRWYSSLPERQPTTPTPSNGTGRTSARATGCPADRITVGFAAAWRAAPANAPDQTVVPVWGRETIRRQPVRAGFPCFGAAVIGCVGATRGDDVEKNRVCPSSSLSGPHNQLGPHVGCSVAEQPKPSPRSIAATSSRSPARSGGILAGLRAVWSAHRLTSGWGCRSTSQQEPRDSPSSPRRRSDDVDGGGQAAPQTGRRRTGTPRMPRSHKRRRDSCDDL